LVFALRANTPPPRPDLFVSLRAWGFRGRGATALRWPPFLDPPVNLEGQPRRKLVGRGEAAAIAAGQQRAGASG
jgi:hypothetical protein